MPKKRRGRASGGKAGEHLGERGHGPAGHQLELAAIDADHARRAHRGGSRHRATGRGYRVVPSRRVPNRQVGDQHPDRLQHRAFRRGHLRNRYPDPQRRSHRQRCEPHLEQQQRSRRAIGVTSHHHVADRHLRRCHLHHLGGRNQPRLPDRFQLHRLGGPGHHHRRREEPCRSGRHRLRCGQQPLPHGVQPPGPGDPDRLGRIRGGRTAGFQGEQRLDRPGCRGHRALHRGAGSAHRRVRVLLPSFWCRASRRPP